MSAQNIPTPDAEEPSRAGSSSWMVFSGVLAARLAVMTGFFFMLAWWLPGDNVAFYAFMACAYVITIPLALWLRDRTLLAERATVHFAVDVLVVTGLVYFTGGLASDLALLYPLVILSAGLIATPRHALQIAAFSVIAYLCLAVLLLQGVLIPCGARPDAMDLFSISRVITLRMAVFMFFGAAAVFISQRCAYINRQSLQLRQLAEIIFHNVRAGLLLLDARNRILMSNERACQLLGQTEQRIVGQLLDRLVAKAPEPEQGEDLESGGAPMYLQRADGSVFPIAQETAPLTLPTDILPGTENSGSMAVRIMVFSDISPLLKMQHAVRLADTIKAMNNVAAGIAHEVRHPLSAISGAIQVINALEQAAARGDRGSTRQLANAKPELVAHILTETERLNDIVEKFINLAEFSPEALTRLFHLQEERPA